MRVIFSKTTVFIQEKNGEYVDGAKYFWTWVVALLIGDGFNGFLVQPNDIEGLIKATKSISEIKRKNCRAWFEKKATSKVFAERVENWLHKGLNKKISADLQD